MSEWDDAADGWDNDATRAYADAVATLVVELCSGNGIDLTTATVCDFGAGTGLLTALLAPRCRRVDAIDTSAAMLARLDAKVTTEGWSNVSTSPTVTGDGYDLVVCSSVLAFVDDPPATIRDLVGRLRPGGLFVHTDWEVERTADEHGFTVGDARRHLDDAGLVSVDVRPAFEIDVGGHTMRPLAGSGLAPTH